MKKYLLDNGFITISNVVDSNLIINWQDRNSPGRSVMAFISRRCTRRCLFPQSTLSGWQPPRLQISQKELVSQANKIYNTPNIM